MRLPRQMIRMVTATIDALRVWSGRHRMSTREISHALQLLSALAQAEQRLVETVVAAFDAQVEQAMQAGRLTSWQRDTVIAAGLVVWEASEGAWRHYDGFRSATAAVQDACPHLD